MKYEKYEALDGKHIYETSVLDNGITVVTVAMAGVRVVAKQVIFKTGSFHDLEEMNGIAHFSEHLIAHSMPDKKWNDLGEELRDIGIMEYNLGTGGYYTTYLATGFPDDVNYYFKNINTGIKNLAYTTEHVELERGRIVPEMQAKQADYYETLRLANVRSFLTGAPARWRGGYPDLLKQFTIEQIKAHHEAMHCRRNLVVFATGAVNHNNICAWASENYGDLPEGKQSTKLITRYTHEESAIDDARTKGLTHFSITFNAHTVNATTMSIANGLLTKGIKSEVVDKIGVYGLNHGAGLDKGNLFRIVYGTQSKQANGLAAA